MQEKKNRAGVSVGPDGRMIVTGGYVTGGYHVGPTTLQSVEEYNGKEWSCGPSLPVATSGHCQLQAGNRTFIIGKISIIFIYTTFIYRMTNKTIIFFFRLLLPIRSRLIYYYVTNN